MKKLYLLPLLCVSLMVIFSGCAKEEIVAQTAERTSYPATVKSTDCGLFLDVEAKHYIYDEKLPDNFQLVEGQRVLLTYAIASSNNRGGRGCNNGSQHNNSSSARTATQQCYYNYGIRRANVLSISALETTH